MKENYRLFRFCKNNFSRMLILVVFIMGNISLYAQETEYCEANTILDMDWITYITTNGAIQNMNYEQNSFPDNGYVYDPDMVIEHYAGGQVSFELGMTEEFYAVNAWVDVDGDFEFSSFESIFDDFSYDMSISGVINIDPDLPNGEYRARVRAGFTIFEPLDPCGDIDYGSTLDFIIRIVDEPSCPTPNSVAATNITTDSAELSWETEGEDLEWEIEYGEAGFELGEGEIIITSDNPYVLTGLESETQYEFRVRTLCDSEESSWSSLKSFSTSCQATDIPYIVDLSDVDIPNIPDCMRTENLSGGNNWTTVNDPGNGFEDNVFMYGWHGSADADAWLYTQGVNLEAGQSYVLTYRYGNNNESYTESMEVAIGQIASSTAMSEVLASHMEINDATAHEEEVVFEVDEDGVYYIGFNALSIANQFNMYLDNISIDLYLDTPDFDSSELTMYPNPTSELVYISSKVLVNQVNVYNVLGQRIISQGANSNTLELNVTTLEKGSYFVEIQTEQGKETLKLLVK